MPVVKRKIAKVLMRSAADTELEKFTGEKMDQINQELYPFDGLSEAERIKILETKVNYLTYEVSSLKKLMRHLVKDVIHDLPLQARTKASFNYQWAELPQGRWMLSNPEFKAKAPEYVCEFTRLAPPWFAGKKVLDAGCGQGRWSYALLKLGAQVVAFDQSQAALETTLQNCAEFADRLRVFQQNVLEPVPLEPEFDLVWSFGMLHHTGDTYRAFQNVVRLVKPGGHLFLMLYAEPRIGEPGDYHYYAEVEHLRRKVRNKPFADKVKIIAEHKPAEDVHGWFDAVSPEINDTYALDELEAWFLDAGFSSPTRTQTQPNHYIIAQRIG